MSVMGRVGGLPMEIFVLESWLMGMAVLLESRTTYFWVGWDSVQVE